MKKYFENGDWEEFDIVNGVKKGKAVYHYSEDDSEDRDREEYNYVDGELEGETDVSVG